MSIPRLELSTFGASWRHDHVREGAFLRASAKAGLERSAKARANRVSVPSHLLAQVWALGRRNRVENITIQLKNYVFASTDSKNYLRAGLKAAAVLSAALGARCFRALNL